MNIEKSAGMLNGGGEIQETKPERYEVEKELPTDIKIIGAEDEQLKNQLEAMGWDKNSVYDLRFALNELLANSIYHGNLDLGSIKNKVQLEKAYADLIDKGGIDKKVYLYINVTPEHAQIIVGDEGRGFIPEEQSKDLTDEEIDELIGKAVLSQMQEGDIDQTGRGYWLMRKAFGKNMVYSKGEEGGTVVTINFDRPKGAAPESA